jgi:hypothetical protein
MFDSSSCVLGRVMNLLLLLPLLCVWGAEELSSGEEEEESEQEAEEPPAPAPKQKEQQKQQQKGQKEEQQQQGAKRPTPAPAAAVATTPQPAKKAKVEQEQKAPATAPAKVPAAKPAAAATGTPGPAAPSNEKEYLAALKAALQQGGALKLATVRARGSAAGGCLHAAKAFFMLCAVVRCRRRPALHSFPLLIPTKHSFDRSASLLSCLPPHPPARLPAAGHQGEAPPRSA